MPRHLQSKIHSEASVASDVWEAYRLEVISLWDNNPTNKSDFNDHLIREFNRKVFNFNLFTGLYFLPFDGGFRFIGSSLGPTIPIPDEGFVYVFASGEQVLLNNSNPIQVPEQYANA